MPHDQRPVWKLNVTESNLFVLVINLNPLRKSSTRLDERGTVGCVYLPVKTII